MIWQLSYDDDTQSLTDIIYDELIETR
jgi:hypothetical protein